MVINFKDCNSFSLTAQLLLTESGVSTPDVETQARPMKRRKKQSKSSELSDLMKQQQERDENLQKQFMEHQKEFLNTTMKMFESSSKMIAQSISDMFKGQQAPLPAPPDRHYTQPVQQMNLFPAVPQPPTQMNTAQTTAFQQQNNPAIPPPMNPIEQAMQSYNFLENLND